MNLTIFLQAANPSSLITFLPLVLIFVVFYFFMIRPQTAKAKEERKFQEDLKRGDRVVTTSGIHGKVIDISADSVQIETGAGKIKFERTAISNELTATRYGATATETKE